MSWKQWWSWGERAAWAGVRCRRCRQWSESLGDRLSFRSRRACLWSIHAWYWYWKRVESADQALGCCLSKSKWFISLFLLSTQVRLHWEAEWGWDRCHKLNSHWAQWGECQKGTLCRALSQNPGFERSQSVWCYLDHRRDLCFGSAWFSMPHPVKSFQHCRQEQLKLGESLVICPKSLDLGKYGRPSW